MKIDDLLLRVLEGGGLHCRKTTVSGAGAERLLVVVGLATLPSRRSARRGLNLILGQAPDLEIAFSEESNLRAARSSKDRHSAADCVQ